MMLDSEMKYLNETILKMSSAVQYNIRQAIELYLKKVDEIDINDELINNYEKLIDEICINTLVKERPYAKDLRELSGVLKLVSDLERIGDHAIDLMEWALRLKNINEKRNNAIDTMLKKSLEMVDNAILSFVNMDYDLALKTAKSDDVIDNMYETIIESLTKYDTSTSDAKKFVVYTTLVVKYIERIADHATNIAEWVAYIVKGTTKEEIL